MLLSILKAIALLGLLSHVSAGNSNPVKGDILSTSNSYPITVFTFSLSSSTTASLFCTEVVVSSDVSGIVVVVSELSDDAPQEIKISTNKIIEIFFIILY